MAASILICLVALWSVLSPRPESAAPTPGQEAGAKERFVCRDEAKHQVLSVTDDRAEVDGVELEVKSTKEVAYETAYKELELSMNVTTIEAAGDAEAKAMKIRYTYFEKTEGDLEIGLERGDKADSVTFKTKSGEPFVVKKMELIVPMGRALALRSTNGGVKLSGYKTQAPVGLSADNGPVTADKLETKKATLSSTNGAIEASAPVCDELDVRGQNGNVSVRDARVKTLSIRTTNGGIELAGSTGESLSAETTNGNIRLSESKFKNRQTQTTNGRVEED